MINDLIELEPLLSQYDAGKVFVGPLLNLSVSSSFRYFYIAGNGGKIYESIGLGFAETETNAQRQRADLIEKWKSRFTEVITPDSHLEMAQAVNALWPNEETASVLALAALEAKAQSTKVADRNESTNDGTYAGVRPGDSGKELVDVVTGKPVTIDPILTNPPPSERAQGQPISVIHTALASAPSLLPDATSSGPLGSGDDAVAQQQRPSGPNQDDVALAVLGLKSSMGIVPKAPGEDTRSLTSIIFAFCAGGCITALLVGLTVFTTRHIADDATPARVPAPLLSANNNPSHAAAVATGSISPAQIANGPPSPSPTVANAHVEPQVANAQAESAPVSEPPSPPPQVANAQAETTPVSGPPSSSPSQVANAQAETPPVSGPPSPPSQVATAGTAPVSGPPSPPPQVASAQTQTAPVSEPQSPPPQLANAQAETAAASGTQSSPAIRLDADAIATFVDRAKDFLKIGDFAAARLLLRRAADAGSAGAALMLGETFDPLEMQKLGAVGIEPDVAQAREWYRKAADLGSEAAAQRLVRLAQTRQ